MCFKGKLRYGIPEMSLVILIFSISNCNGPLKPAHNDVDIIEYIGSNDTLQGIYSDHDHIINDELTRTYHENGTLKSEGKYINNLKEGLHTEWDDNGTKTLEGYFKNGIANGLMKWFHARGTTAGEGNMINGLREGAWKICDIDESGFCIDAYFENDKREGTWKIYHDINQTQLYKEQTFKNNVVYTERCFNIKGIESPCF